ncbi:TIGR00701 family protein [Moraxella caviae]|uniref:Protoporphyrinogen IX oxidase n=1 Tax=Moraxella caviae TaxID=34060 RepID=A0A1S9ZVW4_9GAMM|nr:protoporphyrinogen oxidase HemJ [Moraxella caviae]OOR87608.1 TIGR00701 family protein [Moraxella caviae]STZ13996.1 Predicted membrane protein [Moraxella caviae]
MTFLLLKSLHIVAMVCWFAGIFYLPRLFVYHAMSDDRISQERFALMERKLYRGIMNPAMMATWILGLSMVAMNWQGYLSQGWLHAKLTLVVLLTVYHVACGCFRLRLADNPHLKSHVFWRWFNEIPVFILIGVVLLVVIKPF